jgi:hypothetical protein
MQAQQINRVSTNVLIGLSLTALLAVLSGFTQPLRGEGAALHILQLSILALVPTSLVFFITTNWRNPFDSLRRLTIPAVALMGAFWALYFLEHYR